MVIKHLCVLDYLDKNIFRHMFTYMDFTVHLVYKQKLNKLHGP
jgi:hypothetical protein